MCGIYGIVCDQNIHRYDELKNRVHRSGLSSRGPDESTFFIRDNLHIEHFRLSTYGGKNNTQPVYSKLGSSVCVFNGQIYNYKELLKKYRCEVSEINEGSGLITLLEKVGISVLKEIDGPFALVFADLSKRKLWLARDRWGEKPLYYSHSDSYFCFSSLLEPVIDSLYPNRPVINENSLLAVFQANIVPAPSTLIQGVSQIEAGSYIEIDINNISSIKKERIFSPHFIDIEKRSDLPYERIKKQLDEALCKSVIERARGNGTAHLALSGGVDSAILAAISSNHIAEKINTVTIKLPDESYDESPFGVDIARTLGVSNTVLDCSDEDIVQSVLKVVDNADTPITDPAVVLVNMIAQHIHKNGDKILITGDGADELFMGYRIFETLPMIHNNNRFIRAFFNGLLSIINLLPEGTNNMNLVYSSRLLLSSAFVKPEYAFYAAISPLGSALLQSSFFSKNRNDDYSFCLNIDVGDKGYSVYDIVRESIIKHYLLDLQTLKLDRGTMFNSIDVRCPFLSNEVTSIALTISENELIHKMKGKRILRDILKQYLDLDNPLFRKKKGFRFPLSRLIRGALYTEFKNQLCSSEFRLAKIIDETAVKKTLEDHMSEKADNSKPLWTLFNLNKWLSKNKIVMN